ncbi:Tetratricopeptide repeat family protein [Babesia bovis T2Bo]|uniref:Uncharacterized protein n=2 Tax=Babesia bovis TaxID=5865 RepID=A7AU18_BABBO|nr:Tetratricopeptide repeat family protein [Babesia bovis T2Bo]EDO06429.1 Tetratricopeptide repeat family protein [Babesia bovis T2Bo]BAN65319.1 hypothetical protein [Babesia bovis]|eukprot:XP_001609997.1 hypothetical protein [Babesia bovis T2Bo]
MGDMDDLKFELERLRNQYEESLLGDYPSARIQFEYACTLMCSPEREHLDLAIELLEELVRVKYNITTSMYQLALCHIKRREYKKARRHLDMLLRLEPRNHAALTLRSLLFNLLYDDAMKGSLFVIMASLCAIAAYKLWK